MTGGLTDLSQMLATLDPAVRDGEYVFTVVPPLVASIWADQAEATVVDDEGVTLVLQRKDADGAALPYDFIAAWITLRVRSSLAAVGLTAAVASALAKAEISCNVLAGAHHDHLLVPVARRDAAVEILRGFGG